MTDTLKDRAEKFRQGIWKGFAPDMVEALIAEIKWARENPPKKYYWVTDKNAEQNAQYNYDMGWQSFADHLLQCLGEK